VRGSERDLALEKSNRVGCLSTQGPKWIVVMSMDDSSLRIEESWHREMVEHLLERNLVSEGASSSKSHQETQLRPPREISRLDEKSMLRRLTLAPIHEEDSLMSALAMLNKKDNHCEDEVHQTLHRSSGDDPRTGSLDLMNYALECVWGNLHLHNPREGGGMPGRREAGTTDPSGPKTKTSGTGQGYRRPTGRWVWIRKGQLYEQGLGFIVSADEVR
jgi:hypothetical protein